MTEHINRRDRMAGAIRGALHYGAVDFRDEITSVERVEPNLIEVTAPDGTVYTLRVCQKRNQP